MAALTSIFSLVLNVVEDIVPDKRVCRSVALADATASMRRAGEALSSQFTDWLELARDVHRQTLHRYTLEGQAPMKSQYLQVHLR